MVKDGERARFSMSFRYAGRGVRWMLRHEPNMRVHVVTAAAVLLLGAAFRIPLVEWAALVFAIVLVLLGETLNTAIEAVLDLVQPEEDDRVRVVKDLAAGAVLVASAGAAVIGAFVFVPEVLDALT